jgi:hypothetical protein
MRHAHQLLHSLQSLPSSQHPQRLPSLGYPSIYLLLVKLVKHFCWMLPSYLQWPCHTYLALSGDKGTKFKNTSHKKWYYQRRGLPPGPVGVPSPQSIDAVLNYTPSSYLYFCARPDGSGYHDFSVSYTEHQQKARAYQRALTRWLAQKKR